MTYTITDSGDDYVYCVITRDNGGTFGQMVYGEARKTIAGIEEVVTQAITRVEQGAVPVAAEVIAAIESGAAMTLSAGEPVVKQAVGL